MSFSSDLKNEILENKPMRARFKKAQAYGLFAFSKSFSESSVSVLTENPDTAKLFTWLLRDFLGRKTAILSSETLQNQKPLYHVRLPERADRQRLLCFFNHNGGINRENIPAPPHISAFLSGAYLACGNVTDPEKSYHMEFVVRDEALADSLQCLLDESIPGAKRTARRGSYVVYYKEYAQIEDLLTLMGAPKACLAMIDVEMIKSVRNQANRATNCETANIDKLVNAAAQQMQDIQLLLDTLGGEGLPEHLRAVAELRLNNPDASLRELAAMSEPPMSRSGMHHRLDKLSRMAGEIRNVKQ